MKSSIVDIMIGVGLLPALLFSTTVAAATTTTVTETTKRLRGKPVVHTRTTYKHEEPESSNYEQLVEPNQPHHTLKLRGTGHNGRSWYYGLNLDVLQDVAIKHHDVIHDAIRKRQDDQQQGHHFDHSEDLGPKTEAPKRRKKRNRKSKYSLPTGLDEHYNHTLFEELHDAPFEIYERAFGNPVEGRGSFPVFIVPEWTNNTGIFSGFSRTATPLVFQNIQFLLDWEDIVGASSGAHEDLVQFMDENNFHSTLIIGKAFGKDEEVSFLGLLVSYYQGSHKDILIPFAKLDNFFHDTSEQHLLSDTTKNLEFEALHEMLDEERMNNSTSAFYHPSLKHSHDRQEELEEIEAAHFRKLFQLLIRRSFLFSFGYADCLKSEAHALRDCLDDTFSIVVKMETAVRGALDEELVKELAEVSNSYETQVSEACVTVSGVGGAIYGAGSCDSYLGNLGSFVVQPVSSFQ